MILCRSTVFLQWRKYSTLRLVFSVFALKYTKMTGNTRKIRLFTCLWIIYMTEICFIGTIGLFIPKNICIDTKFVTLTALELKLWHKTWFSRNIFYWHNWIPRPQKHMYRHQYCNSNCLRTQVMAQNVISKFHWRPFWNGLKYVVHPTFIWWHRLLI